MPFSPRLNRREFAATSLALAASATAFAEPVAVKKLVILAGSPSHGPGDHEFNAGSRLLAKCLEGVRGLAVEVHTNGWPKDPSTLETATAILSYADGGGGHPLLRDKRLELIGRAMKKGVGLMCAHFAVEVPKDIGANEFRDWIGGCYEHQFSCNPMWSPEFKTFPNHPIARGVKPFSIRDEWYMNIRFRPEMKGIVPILSAIPSDAVRKGPYVYPAGPYKHIVEASGRSEAMMWATQRDDGGRGVGFTGGHIHKNWADENFRKVFLNALLWLCQLEVPKDGLDVPVSMEDLAANLDPKGKK